jgi:hypothetical protein
MLCHVPLAFQLQIGGQPPGALQAGVGGKKHTADFFRRGLIPTLLEQVQPQQNVGRSKP